MLFNSFAFAVFLPIVFGLYWGSQRYGMRAQNLVLLVASYVFYGWWDWRFLALLFISSTVDYAVGLRLAATDDERRRRFLLGVSVGTNLGILGFFKYFNFFADSAVTVLHALGMHADPFTLRVILPVGVSFYSFQALSYSIDIYRREFTPTRDFIAYHTFGCFFPQLVAGPIERARQLLPQMLALRHFDTEKAKDGLRQLLWGFFKKLVVADTLSFQVTRIFAHPAGLERLALIGGAAGFALQLYADFSGYSDIAIGLGRLFGIDLMRNFVNPFFSENLAELWRRWHISLTSWFRDYLYVPLGGSRVSPRRRAANVLATFAVSGLWHGANWTFVIWGLLNGLAVAPLVSTDRRGARDTIAPGRMLPSLRSAAAMGLTFCLFALFLVFFRSADVSHALQYLRGMAGVGVAVPSMDYNAPRFGLALAGVMLAVEWRQRARPHVLAIADWPVGGRWGAYAAVVIAIALLGNLGHVEFLYFQF